MNPITTKPFFSLQGLFRSTYGVAVCVALFLFFAGNALSQISPVRHNGKSKQTLPTPVTTEAKDTRDDRNLSDIIPKATTLSEKKILMVSILDGLEDTTKVEDQLLEISNQRNHLQEQLATFLAEPHPNYQKLTSMQEILQALRNKAAATTSELNGSITTLDKWINFWSKEEKNLGNWLTGLGPSGSLPVVQKEFDRLRHTIKTSQETLTAELLPLMETQRTAGRMQVSIYELHLQMQKLFENTFQHGIYEHAPFLFSSDYLNQLNRNLWNKTLLGVQHTAHPDTSYLKKERVKIFAAILFFFAFLAVLTSSHSFLSRSTNWQFATKRPLSISFFMALVFFVVFSVKMPAYWLALFRVGALITVLRIGRALITNSLEKRFITRLALLLVVTDLLVVINLPMPLTRLYIILVATFFITLYILRTLKKDTQTAKTAWLLWAERLGVLALLIIFFAEINGQAELAFFIFVATLKTTFAFLLIWVLYLILLLILEIILHYVPLSLPKNNSATIISMVRPLLFIGCILLLLSIILVEWHLFPTSSSAINYLSTLGVSIGGSRISIGLILLALFLLYTAYCTSKIIQSILLQSVLPRRNVDKGVQLSITRLLHYSIMLIGFLLALQSLGFSLTNLTILGGALGVGIGFGLQAIVNNFASGLILLFERPIKVGDTIQVGTELAEVKELGLRATIVQTFDNAEIVVPNSDLITSQVTNWTLKERRVRVKVPVGVAYSSNVEQVLEILLRCANDRPEILSTPPASALFLAFGESSLNFELRVFIPEFTDRRMILSELNLDINREFADAGIEIPFPQSDIHLRSIHSEAVDLISKNKKSQNIE
jgi:small-conductance mechanosensitive channel